jgi:hypothetical protein
MKRVRNAVITSVSVALLWANLASGMSGSTRAGGGFGSGLGRGWVQLKGQVLCATCTLKDLRANSPVPSARLFQLNHQRGQVVMQVEAGHEDLPYHALWLKGDDAAFETLAAEENLFKEVEVSGLMREYLPTSGTLDLATVRIVDEKQKPL